MKDNESFEAKLDALNEKIDALNRNLKSLLDMLVPILEEESCEMELYKAPDKKNDPAKDLRMFG